MLFLAKVPWRGLVYDVMNVRQKRRMHLFRTTFCAFNIMFSNAFWCINLGMKSFILYQWGHSSSCKGYHPETPLNVDFGKKKGIVIYIYIY